MMPLTDLLKTERLILRPWKVEDLEPFAALNADPRVMEYFPSVLTKEESDALAHLAQTKIEKNGWGMWAVSVPGVSDFIGFMGLNRVESPPFPPHFAPGVEIGWRLGRDYWGKGYATEGALACLKIGFEALELQEIFAFTAFNNFRSRAVMERLSMHRDPLDDFDHPKVPEKNPLRRHVLYRLYQTEWRSQH